MMIQEDHGFHEIICSQSIYYLSKQVLYPLQVLDMVTDPHYLYRMTILQAISLLAPVLGSEITSSKLLPLVINASKDR